MQSASVPVEVSSIFAGKLRRYHGVSLLQRLLDVPTVLHNMFDMLLVVAGFLQSLIRLLAWRPGVIFLKGGFVCLPVGYAARLLKIPYVIHDSDAHPGLTNRLLAPSAQAIATGAPLRYYDYPKTKATYTGIPVSAAFRLLQNEEKQDAKESFKVAKKKPLVVVVGGGLGAKRINDALINIAPELIKRSSVVHVCGARQYTELVDKVPASDDYQLVAFVSQHMDQLIGAADVVVSRAGASAMAELASVGASVIIVPNSQLVGGHQLKNADIYAQADAAIVLDEQKIHSRPQYLLETIGDLLDHPAKRQKLSRNLYDFAKPNAAKHVAQLINKAIR